MVVLSLVIVLIVVLPVLAVIGAQQHSDLRKAPQPTRATNNVARVALGMSQETVRAMLGPPSSVMTGGDIVKGSAVVVGMGSVEAFYGRQLWFYDNTPSGAITCITISHHGLVEDIDTRTS